MKTSQFLQILQQNPDKRIAFTLPDGTLVPAHFHITEVGHSSKSFIDCGGTRHTNQACLLQVWVADDIDHRLKASKLLAIFQRAADLLPDPDIPVEIEFEAPVLTQLPLTRYENLDGDLLFHTELKHTDCMAKELCIPDFSLPAIPGQLSCCSPGSGCC